MGCSRIGRHSRGLSFGMKHFLLLVAITAFPGINGNAGVFSYRNPTQWGGTCQSGARQSPIDIRTADVTHADMPKFIFNNYDHAGDIKITNDGVHSVKGEGFDAWGAKQPTIEAGGLKHKYKLVQFHFHWSSHPGKRGSEHTVGNFSYKAELHLVHVRSDLTMDQAKKQGDGLAVLGVFFTVGKQDTKAGQYFEFVKREGPKSQDFMKFETKVLLPNNTDSFYRYDGSLTTPGCDEAVIWNVFSEPHSISQAQLIELYLVLKKNGKPIYNARPTQPLGSRKLLFRSKEGSKSGVSSGGGSSGKAAADSGSPSFLANTFIYFFTGIYVKLTF